MNAANHRADSVDEQEQQEHAPLVHNSTDNATTTCYDSASWFSQLVFGWLSPLLELGNRKGQLDMADLQSQLPLPHEDAAAQVNRCFTKAWQREQQRQHHANGRSPSLARALFMVRS
jgi:hypothetical protein